VTEDGGRFSKNQPRRAITKVDQGMRRRNQRVIKCYRKWARGFQEDRRKPKKNSETESGRGKTREKGERAVNEKGQER
jgi:hypothetical protein